MVRLMGSIFFSSIRRHTRFRNVTGVQTCALPICRNVWGCPPARMLHQSFELPPCADVLFFAFRPVPPILRGRPPFAPRPAGFPGSSFSLRETRLPLTPQWRSPTSGSSQSLLLAAVGSRRAVVASLSGISFRASADRASRQETRICPYQGKRGPGGRADSGLVVNFPLAGTQPPA